MNGRRIYFLIFLLAAPVFLRAQAKITAKVFDTRTREAVPFATVKFGDSGHGTVAALDGTFEISGAEAGAITYIDVSCLGYKTRRLILPLREGTVYLEPDDKALNEVIIKPPYEKMRRIINNAIANKPVNNPDKYDWYRCHVYYKMVADASFPIL